MSKVLDQLSCHIQASRICFHRLWLRQCSVFWRCFQYFLKFSPNFLNDYFFKVSLQFFKILRFHFSKMEFKFFQNCSLFSILFRNFFNVYLKVFPKLFQNFREILIKIFFIVSSKICPTSFKNDDFFALWCYSWLRRIQICRNLETNWSLK